MEYDDFESEQDIAQNERAVSDYGLLGGYKAFMTRRQCNDWQEFAFTDKTCQEYKDLSDACEYLENLVANGVDSRFDQLIEVSRKLRRLQPKAFATSKKWCMDHGLELETE